ncbi:hypothetical protein J2T55_002281 [Methylohalomonas lacus]|uniref:DUF3047 domain-containing protein n=1 Tax=Methylohalomonas lacus TaxID=398773 RepID=A0AAE3HKX2_9GAMM|nr:DUF3047 domain-containing protein [Methylohalomonas lacus]MCS3904245.1 hypothetical protein [Methylohalomonas lacus]
MKTLAAIVLLIPSLVAAETVSVGDFAEHGLAGWQSQSFAGETDYQLVEAGGRRVLKADSRGTASGLYHEKSIDLGATPWLHWRWKVQDTLEDVDETTRDGDDYPARVYVVFSGGLAFWRTHTVIYVWASNQPQGSHWANAFTDNARVIAVQSGDANAGEWQRETRNVRADYEMLFGEDISEADAVAIMTDTDNSDQSAVAWYDDLYFSGRSEP